MLPGQQTFPYTSAPLGSLIFILVLQGLFFIVMTLIVTTEPEGGSIYWYIASR